MIAWPDADCDELKGSEVILGQLSYRVAVWRNCLTLLKRRSTRLRAL